MPVPGAPCVGETPRGIEFDDARRLLSRAFGENERTKDQVIPLLGGPGGLVPYLRGPIKNQPRTHAASARTTTTKNTSVSGCASITARRPAEASFAEGLNRDVVGQAGVDERIERHSTQDDRP